GTATMIRNCIAYYEAHSDLYEIENCGVYWLQGESDVAMAPEKYTKLFMAMWHDLKDAGAEYVAFLRLRKGTGQNDAEHNDLSYTGSRAAQINMVNTNADMYMASTVTENWEGNAATEHTVDISKYITLMAQYGSVGSYNDSYGNAATIKDGMLTTTMKTLYGSNNKCHYGKFGYGIIGADAAYNMYRALHNDQVAFEQTNTSGIADAVTVSQPCKTVTIDITDLTENLSFRAACGSMAGTLEICVLSDNVDITDQVIAKGVNTYGTVDTDLLHYFDNVSITVTYTSVDGAAQSVIYAIVDRAPDAPNMYYWDFDEDVNARDEDGEIVNAFGDAIRGSYTLGDGIFKATGLHLALENPIRLAETKNWSIEWKFGEVTQTSGGFLFTNMDTNAIGNKAIYHVKSGQFMICYYEDSNGYKNYTLSDVHVQSGDVIKLTHRYDSNAGRSVLSLWQNGKLVIADYQLWGSMNNSTSDLDMTAYPLSGDFLLKYLGAGAFSTVTDEFDYIKVVTDEHPEPLSLRYDDRYDVSGKTVEIIDAGTPTSYKIGSGVADGTFDDAVITLVKDKLIATGIGTAMVRIDGALYEITVTPAPISLFMITGHSMGAGQAGNADQSVVGPDGQVYSSHGTTCLGSTTAGYGISYAAQNKANKINAFTADGTGSIGEGSALAWQWHNLTGEKVWVLNTAVGGSCLAEWIPGTTNYTRAVTQFQRAQAILENEIAAGHYTLSRMGIFYHNGANFSYKGVTFTQADLQAWYDAMWSGFQSELSADITGDGNMESVSFLGLVPIWTKSAGLSYTQDEPAGMFMAASAEYPDIFTASVIGQDWLTNADVASKFPAFDYTVQSGETLKRPETTADVFASDNVHYDQVAYNAVGIDIANNLYRYLYGDNALTNVQIVDPSKVTEVSESVTLAFGEQVLLVPLTEPLTCADLSFKAEGDIEISYPLAIKMIGLGTGKLTVFANGEVVREITFVCNHTHTYDSVTIPATCEHGGWTVYTCACGDSYEDTFTKALGHSYEDGTCANCGEKADYAGKKVSILSASTSTYAGVSNNTAANSTIGKNDVYYTEGRHGVYL
ncbi:MAG: hypothetical protein IIX86_01090, partial [Clostridia bacterium]|nr:hypothetical protein [Clostridia bacterium]